MSGTTIPDNKLRNLHHALQLNQEQQPELRVGARITNSDPIPVTIGSESVTLTGDVIVPLSVKVENVPDTQLNVVGDVNILSAPTLHTLTQFSDSANLSAFSRLRTANTRLLGEFRNHYGTTGTVDIVTNFETGGSQTINLSENNTVINVTTSAGSRAVRQSRKYHAYLPGTTNLGFISFKFDQAKLNVHQQVGMFDDLNGIFLRMNSFTPEVVIRKAGTDAQVVTRADWNQDKLDGTGVSGITLDFTQAQIFVLDYQWLGVGRVRVGFMVAGAIIYVHYFTHANTLSEPYMFQPSLPVRWEIANVGATAENSSMMCICYGVYTEGTETETGFDHSVSMGTTSVQLGGGADAVKGLLAVRLKTSVNGKPMRAMARLKDWQVISSLTAQYRVMIIQSESHLVGSPSWTPVSPTGWCEYTTNFALTDTTPSNSIILFDGYATGGSNRGESTEFQTDNRSSAIHQNYDSTDSQIFVIMAYRLGNDNAVMRASMNWIEIK
jgi:hypothetical protein